MYLYFTDFMYPQLTQKFLLFIQWVLYKACQGYNHFTSIRFTILLEPIFIVVPYHLLVLQPFPTIYWYCYLQANYRTKMQIYHLEYSSHGGKVIINKELKYILYTQSSYLTNQ